MQSTAFPEIEVAPSGADPRGVREIEELLERERGRCAGLERGLTALSERVTELRDENARLRQRLALAGIEHVD